MIDSLETRKGVVTLRPAQLEDASAYKALRLRALREEPTAYSSDYEESRARPERTWTDNLRMDQPTLLAVTLFALHEQELIGMATVLLPKSIKLRHAASLVGVYVDLEWRGYHIANALIENCEEWARLRKASLIKLQVTSNNLPAIGLYARRGYQDYGLEPQGIRVEGVDYDQRLMAKILS